MKSLRWFIIVSGIFVSRLAAADTPPYMQVQPGLTAEIKGEWNKDDVFSAVEIELLPESRRPKLRGSIDMIDTTKSAIRVFGQWVVISPSTQFLDVTDSIVAFSMFKPKLRVEVSCKIDSAGQWTARHVRVHNVKSSDKVKGTVTRVAYDGQSPDTLVIESLRVLVTDKTEVFRTLGGSAKTDTDAEINEEKRR